MNGYFENNLRRSQGKDSQFGDIDAPAHAQVSIDIQTKRIPNDSHLLIIEASLGFQDSKYCNLDYLVWEREASYSSIFEDALDALEATLRLMR